MFVIPILSSVWYNSLIKKYEREVYGTMNFTSETFKQILQAIEYRLKFSVQDYNQPQGFDIVCSIGVEEIFNAVDPNKTEEIRYCLAILRQIEYINISSGVINRITPNGYKCICEVLHGINFKY